MAEVAPTKADGPAAAPDLSGAPVLGAPPVALGAHTAAAKKKAAYRSQKAGAAEQILEAVAATKERQAPKLGAVKKTTSATAYEADKAGARPNPPADALPNKGAAVEGAAGGGSSATALRPDREAEGEQGEAEDRGKGGTKRKAAALKKGAAAKPAAQKRATKAAAKRPAKRTAAKAKAAPKRPAASRTAGRRGRGVKRR